MLKLTKDPFTAIVDVEEVLENQIANQLDNLMRKK